MVRRTVWASGGFHGLTSSRKNPGSQVKDSGCAPASGPPQHHEQGTVVAVLLSVSHHHSTTELSAWRTASI